VPVTRESNDHCKHTLPAKQMSAYFVSQNIISTKDEEEIIKPTLKEQIGRNDPPSMGSFTPQFK